MSHPVPATHPEEQGLRYGAIAFVGILTLVIFAVAILWSTHIMNETMKETQPNGPPPVPMLVDRPEIGIVNQRMFELDDRAAKKREAQEKRLSTYGWVDKQRQVARIPIQRAMELLVSGQGT